MQEMNISIEQFEVACMEGRNLNAKDDSADSHSFSFHKGLFQQIWAANDIRIFARLMVQRNVEIQLQALDLIGKTHQRLARLSQANDESKKHVVAARVAWEQAGLTSLLEELDKEFGQSSDVRQSVRN